MDIRELKQELLDNKLRPFYVFIGDELALQDIYIDKIQQLSNLQIQRVDSIASIKSNLSSGGLMKMEPKLFVIRNDEIYLKSEKSWKKFIEATNLKNNICIMLYSTVEKTSHFAKEHDTVLTSFDFIGTSLLTNRLQATTGMPQQYCADIVKLCCNNYGRIKNELYKLCVYARVHKCSLGNAYLDAKKLNLIHEDVGDIIFEFTNAIVERKIAKAYELADKIVGTEDGPLRIISVLYNSFRQILMVQSTPPKERTEQILGMTNAQIYITNQKCGIYNLIELVNIVKILRSLEKGIKIGTVDSKYAIQYLMGQIW